MLPPLNRSFARITSSLVACVALTLFFIAWTPASAQNGETLATYQTYGTIPTNVPGVFAYTEPPSGFNALTATDQELAMYGLPPRPDKTTNPQRYNSWTNRVRETRWKGRLKVTNHEMRPPVSATGVVPAAVDYQQTFENTNWSGVANRKKITRFNGNNTAASSFKGVLAGFNVPVIEDAYGLSGCVPLASGSAHMFVGIDGLVDQEGLAAGGMIAGGVYANNPGWINFGGCSVFAQTYNAELSSPGSTNFIEEFKVNPGDTIFAEVLLTSATSGTVYISDDTLFVYATYALNWAGPLVGSSAEYILAREWVDSNTREALGNYTGDFWTDAQAEDFKNPPDLYGPATNSPNTLLFVMTDDAGDQVISQPIPYMSSLTTTGAHYGNSMYIYAENCAANYGCAP